MKLILLVILLTFTLTFTLIQSTSVPLTSFEITNGSDIWSVGMCNCGLPINPDAFVRFYANGKFWSFPVYYSRRPPQLPGAYQVEK